MKVYPTPENEIERLRVLNEYAILDTISEKEYESITQLASYICNVPIALVSLIDQNRQWFKASVGLDASETSRKDSFCQYTIMNNHVFEVENATEHELFFDNPLVLGDPNIRFYAGAPLLNKNGFVMGSLCVIDTEPKKLNEEQKNALQLLANQVVALLDARKKNLEYLDSQKELQNFIDLSKDLVCIANLDGLFYKVNPAFTAVLGYEKQELEGVPFIDFVHPEDVSKTLEEVEKLTDLKQTVSFENRFRTKEGSYINLSWNTSPDPETGNLYAIARNVQKEKLAEQHLKEVNYLLEESQQIAKIGSWNYSFTSKNLIWSEEHYRIFEMDNLPTDELFAKFRKLVHQDDLIILDNVIDEVSKTGKKFKTNYRIVFPDERVKYILAMGEPVMDAQGTMVAMNGVVQDVTEITVAEQNLNEKSKEIKDIRAALDEAAIVSISDRKGKLTYVNDNFCAVSKFGREELIGFEQPNMAVFFETDFGKQILENIYNGTIWKGEVRHKAKDGTHYWENKTIVPFLNDRGIPYQYISIGTDITDRKNAEENLISALNSLEKKNRELDEYAYVVSHDLKSPLRAIYNLSEWIVIDMPELPQKVKENFDLLRSRVSRMENLINGVLEYSRIGRVEMEKESVDINDLLEQLVDSIVPNNFEVSVGSNFPVVLAERILLQQVFTNLISNAVKYNDKPLGKIHCSYKSVKDYHQFTVKDNGPGIAEAYQQKVFKVFQTIEARDVKESTGIGLAIVKKIVEEKGGIIYIDSKEGEGCSFILTIPKCQHVS
ncbi:PAS domain S-box protein [Flavobacterium sp. LB3R33]|uniref:PAS domain S-box protein n=1 Tax=Flavobacterium sp. LB3R33 TaxID=3401721 RepID=UPI003AB0A767